MSATAFQRRRREVAKTEAAKPAQSEEGPDPSGLSRVEASKSQASKSGKSGKSGKKAADSE